MLFVYTCNNNKQQEKNYTKKFTGQKENMGALGQSKNRKTASQRKNIVQCGNTVYICKVSAHMHAVCDSCFQM